MQAGHRSVSDYYPDNRADCAVVAKALPAVAAAVLNRYCWTVDNGDHVTIYAASSIAFKKLPHKKACQVLNDVEDFVRTLGLEPDEVLKQTERAA